MKEFTVTHKEQWVPLPTRAHIAINRMNEFTFPQSYTPFRATRYLHAPAPRPTSVIIQYNAGPRRFDKKNLLVFDVFAAWVVVSFEGAVTLNYLSNFRRFQVVRINTATQELKAVEGAA